jgi:MerR family copper efflux transcriptional regulator
MTGNGLAIGRVAARAGVKVDTVRFYERRGILAIAERRASGYRTFEPQAVERIVFVKELQSLGFTLDEVIGLLRLIDSNTGTCAAARPHLEATLKRTEEKIAALHAVRDRLAAVLAECEGGQCVRIENVSARVRSLPRHPVAHRGG